MMIDDGGGSDDDADDDDDVDSFFYVFKSILRVLCLHLYELCVYYVLPLA